MSLQIILMNVFAIGSSEIMNILIYKCSKRDLITRIYIPLVLTNFVSFSKVKMVAENQKSSVLRRSHRALIVAVSLLCIWYENFLLTYFVAMKFSV